MAIVSPDAAARTDLPPDSRLLVALYFHRLGAVGGGAERIVCLLANALTSRGFSVQMITWDEENARTFYLLNSDVTWHRLGFRPGLADKFRRTRALADVLRRTGIRVLVGFVMSGDKTVYAAAKLAGVRLVAAERNAPAMYHLRYGRIQRWLSFGMLHLADSVVVQNPDFADGYPASLRGRIHAIPNPVVKAGLQARPDRPDGQGRFTLLAVSRLDGVQKRLDCLVRAFARTASANSSWDLKIIGDGPEEASLRRLMDSLGMSKRIRLEASTPNVFDAYVAAHLFVIPSLWEGFSNAMAEAMSHGLPAVGFREAAGVAQLIADGDTGWLADGLDDEVSLAHTLDTAMADGAERARRGKRAAASMAIYAPEVQFDRWAALLETLTESDTP